MKKQTSQQHHASPDYALAGLTFLMIAFGLIMLSSAGAVIGFEKFGRADYYLRDQALSFGIGLVFFFLAYFIDYHFWRKWAVLILGITIALLVAVFLPGIGFKAGGAQRWIHLGGFLLQPSEIVKLAFLFYLCLWLEKRKHALASFTTSFLPFTVLLATIVLLIIKQPDFGTVTIITVLSIVVYFLAGAPWKHMMWFLMGGGAIFALLIKIAPYRVDRFTVFLNPSFEPQGISYHINQALLAIGSGGVFGLGLGRSRQKYNYLPEVTSDSIYAVIAEELGFLIAVAVLVGFLAFLFRGMNVAKRAPDDFGRLLASGITIWVVAQALINIGAITGVIPLTGVTLPFISSGGSSLLMVMIATGILLNISKASKRAVA